MVEKDQWKMRKRETQRGMKRRPKARRKKMQRKKTSREKTQDPTVRSQSHVRERGQKEEENQSQPQALRVL
ncbi:hypothetical protein NDU88_001453 [Pleurodeles waltl]|uniref:Uncharacterized protein n=1 Tax=Pleurodeles waltl TaxID=8319 RepID=A0AAV7VZ07_PLEWA|nr:hypothetical protein NDU88_001453 [Pleurodeles waltl]